jgi:DNA-binding response OmpR family regulator
MNKIPDILFVDDDVALCRFIASQIDKNEFAASFVHSADEAREKLAAKIFDLAVLDIMMPRINGLQLGQYIRTNYPRIPLIFLTAQTELQYKTAGFEAGADDYVSKPFNFTELRYRIKALLRRSMSFQEDEHRVFQIGSFAFDSFKRKLKSAGKEQTLSLKEAELLTILCNNMNRVVGRDEFLVKIWGKTDEFTIDSMNVYLSRLRKYFRDEPGIKIDNLRGTGFSLMVS